MLAAFLLVKAEILRKALCWTCAVIAIGNLTGCQANSSRLLSTDRPTHFIRGTHEASLPNVEYPDVRAVSHSNTTASPPPRVHDIGSLERWPMSLDDAIHIALQNNSVVRDAGGRVLVLTDSVRTPYDPAILATDPNLGATAALSAFDTRLESSLFWNGGGRTVGAGLLSGAFGVFSQPTTMATVGLGKTLSNGTRVNVGGVGGYDSTLASGLYAAFGGEFRHPFLRGAGTEVNRIAGPYAKLGTYRGVWIARIDEQQSGLELERAVRNLVRDLASTYWELYFAYRNLDAKHAALEQARQSWKREQDRVAQQASPPDAEAIARQQYYTADAAVQTAISGARSGPTGVYDVETKLRKLMGLPVTDGLLILPIDLPLEADFRFDWNEALRLAQSRRVELRKQQIELQKKELELKAARNLQRPQVDFVGQYRRLAGDPNDNNALFSEALHGWRVGIEVRRALGNRRENAAVRNAELRLSREHALLNEQELQVSAELRTAFTELDRAYGVTQSLAVSSDAAKIRLQAEAKRHAEGDANIERVLEAQIRATQAETSFLRSLVDHNLAFINVHFVRGTFLEAFGVGFSDHAVSEQIMFTRNAPSIFAGPNIIRKSPGISRLPQPPRDVQTQFRQ